MTASPERQNKSGLGESQKLDALKNQSDLIEEGPSTRYQVRPTTDTHVENEPYRKMTFGERDTKKKHKTILLVGETGTGKTKLINGMINYMLGVKREDNVWFEITDDQSKLCSAYRQTTIITVYGFYLQESETDLTIIDTPGYGDLRASNEKEIAMGLLKLSRLDERVKKLDAVCLVIKSTQIRLSERQIYIFDAVQSLFGRDVVDNIVLFFTHSHGTHPKNALTAVNEAHLKCAVNDQNQPVYFMFDNCQGETFHEEYQMVKVQSWNLSFKGMAGFFKFLGSIKAKTLQMTQDVLQQREQLEKIISQIKDTDEKQKKNMVYKEKVDIDHAVAYKATCCTVCKENCHYPGCWWVKDLSWCSVMTNNHCTVCTNKCHYSKHVKEAKIYVTKNQYDDTIDKNCAVPLDKKLEEKLKAKKLKLVMDAFHCMEKVLLIAINNDSLIVLLHVDFLIEKMEEIEETEKEETLKNIKIRAGEEKRKVLEYMKLYNK